MLTDDCRKEVKTYGICTGPEGSDESKNKGYVQPDKTAADLFRTGGCGGSSLLSFDKKDAGIHLVGVVHGHYRASVFLFCHV